MSAWRCAACAVAVFVGLYGLVRGDSAAVVGAALVAVLGVAEAARCDMARRRVPYELCALVAAAGSAFQVLAFGWWALAGALALAVCSIALCFALSYVVRRLSRDSAAIPIGGGDVRCVGAIVLATGEGAFFALGVAAVSAALFCTARFVARSPHRRDPVPFAPFLALGLVGGVVVCL